MYLNGDEVEAVGLGLWDICAEVGLHGIVVEVTGIVVTIGGLLVDVDTE